MTLSISSSGFCLTNVDLDQGSIDVRPNFVGVLGLQVTSELEKDLDGLGGDTQLTS